MKYAIKYLRVNYIDDIYVLIPKKVVRGDIEDGEYFATTKEVFEYMTNRNMDGKYVIGDAYTIEELRNLYQCGEEFSDRQVSNIFFEDQSEKMTIFKDGQRFLIDTFEMFGDGQCEKIIYQNLEGENCVLLNQKIIDQLEGMEEYELKEYLRKHADRIANFEEERKSGVQYILVKDGKKVEVGTDLDSENNVDSVNNLTSVSVSSDNGDVSVKGLYDYLRKHIMGHDQELKWISTIMVMNYMSNPYYGTESILVPGPTGTGKTATFKCVSDYFNLPFLNVNVSNLVPEGIVGTTVEDEFAALLDSCSGDNKKAEKAIITFDEFDKIGVDGLDIKQSLINVFLKVLEGGRFPINRQMRATQVYHTGMSSKICLGTFDQAFKKDNPLGFRTDVPKEIVFDKDLIVSKGYFSKELLSRIHHFIPYGEISDEDKKRIILESKLSTYMMKKERLENQFGIKIEGDQEFALGVMDALKKNDQSVRDINNIIARVFLDIEYEILDNPNTYKRLVLSRSTPKDSKFDLS